MKEEKLIFERGSQPGDAILDWWLPLAELQIPQERNQSDWTFETDVTLKGKLRGERAALRRAAQLRDVYWCKAYHRLMLGWQKALGMSCSEEQQVDVAAVAWVLCDLKRGNHEKLGATFAKLSADGGEPRIREQRFRQFLDCRDRDEMCRTLRRMLSIVEEANPLAVARFVYYWAADESGDLARRELATDYYYALLSKTGMNSSAAANSQPETIKEE